MHHLSIDVETFSSVDIRKAGAFKYTESPDFQILLFAYSLDGAPVQVIDLMTPNACLPQDVLRLLFDPACIKHAFNAIFEILALSRYFGLTDAQAEAWLPQWRCTMLHAMYLGLPRSLKAVGAALGFSEDKRKLSTGDALIRYFCVPCKPTKNNGGRTRNLPHHDPARWELFKQYNARDVETEMTVEKKLSNFPVPDEIQRQWELDQRINLRGVAVDMELVAGARWCGDVARQQLIEEAIQLTGLDNPNSVGQLTKWLEDALETELADLSKATVTQLLDNGVPCEKAERVLQIRQELSKASVKKFDAIEECVCADGRVRGLLQFYGANRTGREAGRLVQIQNLPRHSVEALDFARELVKNRNINGLRFCYGSVPHALSALIRTAFVAAPGHVFIDADFSAIEARVIAWLAGEDWVLDVFKTHGKIYEATAAQMFGVPMERIKKGNPEYEYRQKGKVATLALGYQGGTGALIQMGALKMGLTEAELPDIVERWRRANPNIVQFWYDIECAAMKAVTTGEATRVGVVVIGREWDAENGLDFLTIQLPSGRKLYYPYPHLAKNRFGRDTLAYYNQSGSSWRPEETYGGKLAENCLAKGTLVLTKRGWMRIEEVLNDDLLWDGIEWVPHTGLLFKGVRKVISVDGLLLTADHYIFTKEGWARASSCKRHNRYTPKLPHSSPICRLGRKEIPMGHTLRLWQRIRNACYRILEGKAKILRMHETARDFPRQNDTRPFKAPSVSCMAIDDSTLHTSDRASMEKLWRSRHSGVRPLDERFQIILGGHVPDIQTRADARQNRREWRLLPRKLPVGSHQDTKPQSPQQSNYSNALRKNDSGRSRGKNGDPRNNPALQVGSRLPGKYVVRKTGRYEPVYDLQNAGPRHRFTVLSDVGPVLVHNCTQAVARDCLFHSLMALDAAGYKVVFDVHDEVVIEAPAEAADLGAVAEIMSRPIPWAPGLPLNAEGWVGGYYRKD